jgi:hypothetical protein
VDSSGAAYVTGNVQSPNFPTTPGAFDTILNGPVDAFVTKLNPTGSGLVYSTFLGGSSWDEGDGLAIDSAGDVYIAGHLASSDFPTTAGAFDTTFNLTKLNPSGSSLIYSTYLGGSAWDGAFAIAVDSAGAAYLTGFSQSVDFPTTAGAFDRTQSGDLDAFVAKIDPVRPPVPGTLTFTVAVGADDGDVNVNNMGGGGGYPPVGAASVWSSGTRFGVRRAGPLWGGYEVRTALLRFDTSSIPAGATVTSASLRLYVLSRASVDGRNLVAEWDNGAAWPMDASDYTATASNTASAGVAIGSLSVNAVNALSLQNLGSISRSGYTTLRLHVDGGQPTGENGAFFNAFENGALPAAQLIVNYTS